MVPISEVSELYYIRKKCYIKLVTVKIVHFAGLIEFP